MSRLTSVMKLPKLLTFVFVVSIVLCTARSVHAMYSVANEGRWPKSWPKELEPLRKQSRTLVASWVAIYEIRFANREEFESAWPHIVELRSKGAPITLLRGPHKKLGATINAGVRIHAPRTGSFVTPRGAITGVDDSGELQRIGPPWPDHIKSETGVLPEYVFDDNGKWASYQPEDGERRDLRRARLEIELVIDGDIVDLNRIPLPADTPIIDKRFED